MTTMRTQSFSLAALSLVLSIAVAATQWTMQPQHSALGFTGLQSGIPFDGVFKQFTADVKFDPQDLPGSRFDVTIDMTSIESGNPDRDDAIKSADLFDVKQWPSSRYVAETFAAAEGSGKFTAIGTLTLRNVTRKVPIEFSFEGGNDGAWLKGVATIKRLDFGVGQGEWQDTSSVANEVVVHFNLLLKKP
jgi:polyisoprenoid-binding protein YceI